MYQLNIHQQTITIEGKKYNSCFFIQHSFEELLDYSQSPFIADLFFFLKEWFSDVSTVNVKTSGSTGIPKRMQVEKERMMHSAVLTCSFLKLKKGDKALLCMPLQYIAGKMVVVRSLVCNLDLYPIQPSGNPFKNIDLIFDFAALVPLQVFNTIKEHDELETLKKVKNLIIGGGSIDLQIEKIIKKFPNNVYSTYGMTETLSHIALRKLSGQDASTRYIPFDSVTLSLAENNTLIINAPLLCEKPLYTNDIVDISSDGSFRVLGRVDNIINTGGIKVQIEEVEQKLREFIDTPFAISSLPDPKFGEIVVLVAEQNVDLASLQKIKSFYYIPKKCILVDKLPLTETGKIDRYKLKRMILK